MNEIVVVKLARAIEKSDGTIVYGSDYARDKWWRPYELGVRTYPVEGTGLFAYTGTEGLLKDYANFGYQLPEGVRIFECKAQRMENPPQLFDIVSALWEKFWQNDFQYWSDMRSIPSHVVVCNWIEPLFELEQTYGEKFRRKP